MFKYEAIVMSKSTRLQYRTFAYAETLNSAISIITTAWTTSVNNVDAQPLEFLSIVRRPMNYGVEFNLASANEMVL